ncbi:NUDIX hydrolase [Vibrio sp. Of7-15]|uniref:NUDIX hydrolase n=1 Tax=Vibrio sp. Of7-15 TaxID=2724879 RepID=UPI001EF1A5AF|nr:NUDIX hydrolase [Vibrio sp. Of7-15]MCG7495564.1 NUDIX hydrolase [Vibrio sp. Of7-15]
MTKKIIHSWKNIQLTVEDHQLPTGKAITHTSIEHPGAAVIIPILNNGHIVLVNQYRPSLNKWLLEIPAGTMESGENPLLCAQRELKEETGYEATDWQNLGQITPLAGFCDEIQHLFLAKNLSEPSETDLDEDELISVITLSLSDIEQKIISNDITDAKTIACISKAKLLGLI